MEILSSRTSIFALKYPALYIAALIIANLLVYFLGPWFSVVNSFVLIGLDLTLRDKLHEQWAGNKLKLGLLIAIASSISYALNPATGAIALASFVAFALSMLADTFVYQSLIQKSWKVKANCSNIAGAAVDSIVFPTLAFGGIMIDIVLMQFLAKMIGGLIWSKIIKKDE